MHCPEPQQLCPTLSPFSAQPPFPPEQHSFATAAEHFSVQQCADASVLAQLFPSLPSQHEALSFAEQQDATFSPSFAPDFACMQASWCLRDAAAVPDAV